MEMQKFGIAALAGALAIGPASSSQGSENPFSGMAAPGLVDRREI